MFVPYRNVTERANRVALMIPDKILKNSNGINWCSSPHIGNPAKFLNHISWKMIVLVYERSSTSIVRDKDYENVIINGLHDTSIDCFHYFRFLKIHHKTTILKLVRWVGNLLILWFKSTVEKWLLLLLTLYMPSRIGKIIDVAFITYLHCNVLTQLDGCKEIRIR